MGNSMGGATSVGVAARHPELVHALVLVNAAFPRPGANLDQLARTARYAALTLPAVAAPIVRARAQRLGPERLVDTTLGLVFSDRERIDPALRERLVALAVERRAYPEAARVLHREWRFAVPLPHARACGPTSTRSGPRRS